MTKEEFIQKYAIGRASYQDSDFDDDVKLAEGCARELERAGHKFDDLSLADRLERIESQLDGIRQCLISLRQLDGEEDCSMSTIVTAISSIGEAIDISHN